MSSNKLYSLTTIDPEDAILPDNKIGEAMLIIVMTTGLVKEKFGLNSLKPELRKFIDQDFQKKELRDAAKFLVRRPQEMRKWLKIFSEQQLIEEVS